MAIPARNLASKLSLGLQSRVFSIPWVKTNKSMLCMKGRACSSSVPVRYIPNKVARTKEPKNSPSLKSFRENDEVGESWNGVERRSIILSEEKSGSRKPITEKNFAFDDAKKVEQYVPDGSAWSGKEIDQNFATVGLELMDEPEEVDEEIESYQGKAKQKILQDGKTMKDAEKLAVGKLATRAFTAVELRKKLLGKKFPPDTVEAVITDFQSRGLLNDSLYAETFAQSRFSSSSWGPRRIKQALFKKGVSEVDSEKAVKFVFKDGKSNEDQESNLGLSKQSMDHLFVQASKQWLRGQDVPKETRKSRIIRWLQYRGFSWGVVGSILKKLESQYPL
ncbi:hypothetical protein HS088_TW21G00637 [Tripterygium wilfordii]|uniref:Regulatory protein RecX n=1 Tax=Tripterygium wilfordii TaxID=458696 RepID=A0A7J7C2V4_TRIWF|nr:regulatory protein RecX [Tripterygium wilfordii]KAF5728489.1 hypothetical protein HS088_TW21G00637 [Tripterygium wilfordii]